MDGIGVGGVLREGTPKEHRQQTGVSISKHMVTIENRKLHATQKSSDREGRER